MKHRLFPILSVLSLLLCLATAITPPLAICLALPSSSATRDPLFLLHTKSLQLYIHFYSTWRAEWILSTLGDRPTTVHDTWRCAGLCLTHADSTPGWAFVVPYYWPPMLTSLLPLSWLTRRLLHHRRLPPGLCPTCRYDLRASKNRCPECGSPIPDGFPRPILSSNNP